jgi:NAD(P)-dependent dehydrogenase (short-subunit alcohol dehydrogenase family)
VRGKIAIVTGASRGIGKAIALGFAAAGAAVVVAARSESAPHEKLPGTIYDTAAIIEAAGGRALAVRCDVTDQASVAAMVERTLAEFGRIDVLVNNAAVDFPSPVVDMPLKRWEIVLKVDLTGPFLCARAVLPTMIARKSGSIVNITSQAGSERGSKTVGYSAAYAAAKAALDRFTWALAVEVKEHGIAVNALKPAKVVDTEGMRMWATEEEKKTFVPPDTMVACALFLAGRDAKSLTGMVATDEEYIERYGLVVPPAAEQAGGPQR